MGACVTTGQTECRAGEAIDTCQPLDPALDDGICDGVDDDCDGAVDEDSPCNGCPAGTEVPAGYVCVPAGENAMGSPPGEQGRDLDEVRHPVRITAPFLLGETEVTQAEWLAEMGANPSSFREGGPGCAGDPCDARPVETVSWYDALAYLNALSVREGFAPCYDLASCDAFGVCDEAQIGGGPQCEGYRLPTEAEWEYAARAGSEGAVYNEDAPWPGWGCWPTLDLVAWYSCNADRRTHPVAELLPNPWGLYDILGNVREWTWDDYREDYEALGIDDPVSPPVLQGFAAMRVGRGGDWSLGVNWSRLAKRHSMRAGFRHGSVGLRVSRSLP